MHMQRETLSKLCNCCFGVFTMKQPLDHGNQFTSKARFDVSITSLQKFISFEKTRIPKLKHCRKRGDLKDFIIVKEVSQKLNRISVDR